jgi:hypothetical protein
MTGKRVRVVAAINGPQSAEYRLLKTSSPSCSVLFELSLVMIKGQRKSSHACVNVKMARADNAGFPIGINIRLKIANSVAPSIRAASESSFGNWR